TFLSDRVVRGAVLDHQREVDDGDGGVPRRPDPQAVRQRRLLEGREREGPRGPSLRQPRAIDAGMRGKRAHDTAAGWESATARPTRPFGTMLSKTRRGESRNSAAARRRLSLVTRWYRFRSASKYPGSRT